MARPYSLPPTEILKVIDFWTTYLDKHELTTASDYRIAVRSTLKLLQMIALVLCASEEARERWETLFV